ncbi:hypothetical protein AB0J63_20835 [Streptosporangium canum]|uniref:hypothetical protein n=1 Tax=Streptosporangium canum TaxID=324952 RepID=UPI003428C86F
MRVAHHLNNLRRNSQIKAVLTAPTNVGCSRIEGMDMTTIKAKVAALSLAFTTAAAVAGVTGASPASASSASALDECSDLGYANVGLIARASQGNSGWAIIIYCGWEFGRGFTIDVKSGPDPACAYLSHGEKALLSWNDGSYRGIKYC